MAALNCHKYALVIPQFFLYFDCFLNGTLDIATLQFHITLPKVLLK